MLETKSIEKRPVGRNWSLPQEWAGCIWNLCSLRVACCEHGLHNIFLEAICVLVVATESASWHVRLPWYTLPIFGMQLPMGRGLVCIRINTLSGLWKETVSMKYESAHKWFDRCSRLSDQERKRRPEGKCIEVMSVSLSISNPLERPVLHCDPMIITLDILGTNVVVESLHGPCRCYPPHIGWSLKRVTHVVGFLTNLAVTPDRTTHTWYVSSPNSKCTERARGPRLRQTTARFWRQDDLGKLDKPEGICYFNVTGDMSHSNANKSSEWRPTRQFCWPRSLADCHCSFDCYLKQQSVSFVPRKRSIIYPPFASAFGMRSGPMQIRDLVGLFGLRDEPYIMLFCSVCSCVCSFWMRGSFSCTSLLWYIYPMYSGI